MSAHLGNAFPARDQIDLVHHVVAVQLEEGPIIVSNLSGPEPSDTWIGKAVEIVYESGADGETLPRVRLTKE